MADYLAILFAFICPFFSSLAGEMSLSQHLYRDNFSLGYTSTKWEYSEFATSKDNERIMKDSGNLSGATLKYYSHSPSTSLFMVADLMYLTGNTLYEGQYTDGRSVSIQTRNSIAHLAFGLGTSFDIESLNSVVSLSASAKYRTLQNANSGVQGDYSRKIDYVVAPLQSRLSMITSNGNIIEFGIGYDYFLTGRVYSKLSEAIENHPDVVNFQDKGEIWKAHATYTIVGGTMSFSISPYLKVYRIKDSDTAQVDLLDDQGQVIESRYYYEPANETQMTGLNISVNF